MKRKIGKKRKKSGVLSGLGAIALPTKGAKRNGELNMEQLGIGVAALVVSNMASSVCLGNNSGIPGLVIMAAGAVKKNLYLTMAGAGMFLAGEHSTTQAAPASTVLATTNGVDGFDFASFKEKAKERAKGYLLHMAEKLHLPVPAGAVNGMGDTDNVSYFVNPYTQNQQVDMSALDKIQGQLSNNNLSGQQVVEDADAGERNL